MTFWNDKQVLVTGGAGFLGRHLVAALYQAGAQVTVLDDLSTGQRVDWREKVTFMQRDIAQGGTFPAADIIFNLASPASPPIYQRDPIQTWKSNILGTLHMLDHALAQGAMLVQASTSEVYGDPLSHPQRESDWGHVNPVGPRACYDESKRAAETLLMDASRTRGADIRIARIFNTYGPGMNPDDGRLVPNFVNQARAGLPLTVYGDGTQTRSLCYVADTVEGLLALAACAAARGEVVNLGNPHEQTVLDIAKDICAVLGVTPKLRFLDLPDDDPVRRCPDITKAKTLLGWSPRTDLRSGLRETIADTEAVA